MNRPAFTLIELMIATALTCVIAAGTYVFFAGSGRISREGYDAISSALANRVARERSFLRAQADGTVNPPVGRALEQKEDDE